MPRHSMRPLPLIVIVLLLCAACGQAQEDTTSALSLRATALATTASAGAEGSDDTADTCSFVNDEEIGTAIDKTVTRHEENSGQCTYYTDDPVVFVTLDVDTEDADASWQGVKGGNSLTGAEENKVEGIGEEAFFGARDILYVKDGDIYMSLEAGFDTETRERAKKLAPMNLEKLKQ